MAAEHVDTERIRGRLGRRVRLQVQRQRFADQRARGGPSAALRRRSCCSISGASLIVMVMSAPAHPVLLWTIPDARRVAALHTGSRLLRRRFNSRVSMQFRVPGKVRTSSRSSLRWIFCETVSGKASTKAT